MQCLYINYTSVNLKKKRKKKVREGEGEREKEGRKKQRGREERKEEECKKERKKTAVREGSGFSPFRTNDKSSISHPVPIWGLDFHLSPCCFCALLFPSERKHLSYTKGKEI